MALVMPKQRDKSFNEFREKYFFYLPESQKNVLSDEQLNIFLDARYRFFRERSDELKVSIYNPNSDFHWLKDFCVVEILMPDSPFIVDTVVDICNDQGHKIKVIIHPILSVTRTESGSLQNTDFPESPGNHESYVYLEINRLNEKELDTLTLKITKNLQELRSVVTDYPKMMSVINSLGFEHEDVIEEMEWLKENFVLLGLSHLKAGQPKAPHFGVLKKTGIRKNLQSLLSSVPPKPISYYHTELHTNINKNRQLYFIRLNDSKKSLLLAGHFRHRADIALRNSIPGIRRMLDNMAKELRVSSTSYLRKELYKTAQAFPVGLLLTRTKGLLSGWFLKIISNMYTDKIIHDFTIDQGHNLLWVGVILPLTEAGKIPNGALWDFQKKNDVEIIHSIRYQLNQIEVVFLGFRSRTHTIAELKKMLQAHAHELFSTWSSRFQAEVANAFPASEKGTMVRFMNGMSPDYEVHQEPAEVMRDLQTLESMAVDDGYRVDYYYREIGNADLIKIYSCVAAKLSDLVPILSNFGFSIDRDYTFPYSGNGTMKFTYVFSVPANKSLDAKDRNRVTESITAVLNKELTSKPINELVLVAGLTARELNLVKAFCAYFYKIDTSFAFSSIQKVLVNYPDFTNRLVRFFKAKFVPAGNSNETQKAEDAVEACFRDLKSVEDEKICKSILNIVNAIVRTNYFLDKPEISFKIRSGLIENMPKPVPQFEIYIYSHDMEGVHLRGGPIARGGIRWSDRQDDLRAEVLGLMKAQMVKNTVIVPVGSKGGFVVKNRRPDDREAWLKTGVEMYKRFISCLLDLTDNLATDSKVIPSPGIVRLDGDDPYLVVAADKGTATFSDIANEISIKRKFWLTDAFASGGSNGYDHKKQGITAKGTWESVKRHFHEIGINPENYLITIAGIGDMGGDVFGNGMLLSKTIKLVAAFNHLYIFIDPNPDPELSFQERKRLFGNCANWDEYNPELISAGGGVFLRRSRKIELSPEARQMLGVKTRTLSGEELIKAILRTPVDLLWNGGIGTYVKADHETHFQAQDPANDRVRINASELRAKVIGEGGNLGLTQAARVQAANQGVRLNTDAIDNSAGVNMSDHEVNLKILLDSLLRKKVIKNIEDRNEIIKKSEKAEIDLVLIQNYHNNLGLSLDFRRVPQQFIYMRALIKFLNRIGAFDRVKDSIPFEADLDKLGQQSKELPRPVLCSLVGFAKLYGTQLFLDSNACEDPWYDRFILRYFPEGMRDTFQIHIKRHPLKREIIVTEIINYIVNHAGVLFFQRMYMETGKPVIEIAATYLRIAEFLKLQELRSNVEIPGEWLNANIHYEYLIFLEEKAYQITKKVLQNSELLKLLDESESRRFNRMLQEAARLSRYRLARKPRITLRILTSKHQARIKEAFKQVDTLEDTFSIFTNNKIAQQEWLISEYFNILRQYRIYDLRQILKELSATSSWEMRFMSKIETSIEKLIERVAQLKHSGKSQKLNEVKPKIKNILNDIIDLNAKGSLSTAEFYEMLEFVNGKLLSG